MGVPRRCVVWLLYRRFLVCVALLVRFGGVCEVLLVFVFVKEY